jgi:parallel beta helix pectate lyase-like protein
MRGLLGLLLLLPVSLFAANATVDCFGATPGAFTSINAALATLDVTGPHLVSVSGTCVENAIIRSRDRVTLEGNPTATIQPAAGVALLINRARTITLRRLTLTGGTRALAIQRQSDVIVEGVTVANTPTGVVVDDGSIASFGGLNPLQAVTIAGNGLGLLADGATVYLNGNVTIENSTNGGNDAEHSRIAILGGPASPNVIRNNGANGVFAHGTSDLDFRGLNEVRDNTLNGVFAFESTAVDILGTPTQTTTIDGNLRGGVVLLFNSSGRVQNVIVTNNGSLAQTVSSGVTIGQNSSAIINVSLIDGTTGPGLIVDSGSMGRVAMSTISGNSAEPIRLLTGGILELQDGNTIPGSGNIVVCDDSAVIFGTGANVKTSCKKAK